VMALDRLVSINDYTFFSRTFAGIGKAAAARISDGFRQIVYVTIAGVADAPIDSTSDVYRNLVSALNQFGDLAVPIKVDVRELVVLVTSAKISLLPDYQWDDVSARVRANILDKFGFPKRALGQPALLCELIAIIQNTQGVQYVDVDAFGGVPEKVVGQDGTRTLIDIETISERVQAIAEPDDNQSSNGIFTSGPLQRVDVNQPGLELGKLRPAQLAIFTGEVPDTIVLNQKV